MLQKKIDKKKKKLWMFLSMITVAVHRKKVKPGVRMLKSDGFHNFCEYRTQCDSESEWDLQQGQLNWWP